MYLLDEKNEDLVIHYDVIFSEKSRDFISSKLNQLVTDSFKNYYSEKNPNAISNVTPFTTAFIWNKSQCIWGLAKSYSEEDKYVRDLAGKINTDNLSLLFKHVKNIGKLYAYLATNPRAIDDIFVATYPDIAHFSSVFPSLQFSYSNDNSYFPNIMSITDIANHKYDYYSDEYDMEVLEGIVEIAKNNTEVVKN